MHFSAFTFISLVALSSYASAASVTYNVTALREEALLAKRDDYAFNIDCGTAGNAV